MLLKQEILRNEFHETLRQKIYFFYKYIDRNKNWGLIWTSEISQRRLSQNKDVISNWGYAADRWIKLQKLPIYWTLKNLEMLKFIATVD